MLSKTALNIFRIKKNRQSEIKFVVDFVQVGNIIINENAFLKRAGDWLDDVTQRVPLSTNQIIPHEGASVSP